MKKLLQINSVINSGSTGRIAEQIGKLAISNSWESHIAFARNDQHSCSHKIHIGNKWDVLYHGFQSRIFDNHGFASKKATTEFIKKIKKIDPSIIHLHNIHGYYLNIEILFSFLSEMNIPVVWTLHDCWAMTGHCAYFDYVQCDKWKIHCQNCPQKRSYPSSFFKDNSYNNFENKKRIFNSIDNLTIISVSEWLKKKIEQSFLNRYPTEIIHNGVDTNIFKPSIKKDIIRQKYNIADKFVILGVANVWDKRKGFEDFIEYSKFLKKDEVIILVGLNKDQLKILPENIIGIERTENINELVDLYSVANVVFNISREETFGMTTVEGFACGVPSVVYNCTASPELISENTGFVVEAGDMGGLAKAVSIIKAKGAESYIFPCRKQAVNQYEQKKQFSKYIDLYEKLLS